MPGGVPTGRSQPNTLGYEIKELISRFPPVTTFGEHWLVSYIIKSSLNIRSMARFGPIVPVNI